MIVYGERARRVVPADELARLEKQRAYADALPGGLARHAALVSVLLAAGELAQGLEDAAFASGGLDRHAFPEATALLHALARAVWASRFGASMPRLEHARSALAALRSRELPDVVEVRTPEGFAYYAVYPELYALAAHRAGGGFFAIGLRSIGTSLGAMVGAVDGETAFSVRPVGPPFDRSLSLGAELACRALAAVRRGARVALVDEGPGMSGSSLLGAARALEARGVPRASLVIFPSHAGTPGAAASPEARARWGETRRAHVAFEDALLGGARPRVRAWLACDAGTGLDDLSAGRWRAKLLPDATDWPPVDPMREARKLAFTREGSTRLAKFVGLGRRGERMLVRARELARLGLVPPVLELVHGFLVTDWMAGARPLVAGTAVDRAAWLAELGRHLVCIATRFPAEPNGARPDALLAMMRHNLAAVVGEPEAAAVRRFEPELGALSACARPVAVDGRLHRWEWLRLPDGSLRKCDAIEHHDGHDAIGPQDVAWDVAGAMVELELDESETDALRTRLARAGVPCADAMLRFHELAYLAFQLGLAASATSSCDAADRERWALRERSLRTRAHACLTRL